MSSPNYAESVSDVSTGRELIDSLDNQIIAMINERRKVSDSIQRERVKAGGTRVELSRETEIYRRYHNAFGRQGTAIASAFLQLCRGTVG